MQLGEAGGGEGRICCAIEVAGPRCTAAAGYSALSMAQALPPGGRVVSFEKDLSWVLVAKRFCW